MRAARLPISFRDNCAGLLIPLNKCRQANMYMPFRCGHERHEYEKWCVLARCQGGAPLAAALAGWLAGPLTRTLSPTAPPPPLALRSMYVEHLKQVKKKLDSQ